MKKENQKFDWGKFSIPVLYMTNVGLAGAFVASVLGACSSSSLEGKLTDNVKPRVVQVERHETFTAQKTPELQPANAYHVSEAGINFIKSYEGEKGKFVNHVYLDSAGKPTIAYGHLVLKGEHFGIINEKEATDILRKDLSKAESAVKRGITVPIKQNQYDALVSFAFNAGAKAVTDSELQRELDAGKYDAVPIEMVKWNKVTVNGKKTPCSGLDHRRADEIELFRDGDYVRNH